MAQGLLLSAVKKEKAMVCYPELEGHAEPMKVMATGVSLEGELLGEQDAGAVVVMPHVTGEPVGPRLHYLAWLIRQAGFATALIDLAGGESVVDPGLLAERLGIWSEAIAARPALKGAPIAYLASGLGASAALTAVSRRGHAARTVVCWGGRMDVPTATLERVTAPVLLIAPGNDPHALRAGRNALSHVHSAKRIDVIAGAHHLFEEPGALCQVALRARRWLRRHLRPAAPPAVRVVDGKRGAGVTDVRA